METDQHLWRMLRRPEVCMCTLHYAGQHPKLHKQKLTLYLIQSIVLLELIECTHRESLS